ncbi:MAG: ABC transporter permease subunit [Thomasclavelia ramosa]
MGTLSITINVIIIAVFIVIIIVPFVGEWPYRISFTFQNVINVFSDATLLGVIKNSLITASLALLGTLVVYGAALASARSTLNKFLKKIIESIALATNTIPGMVLGIAYLLMFSGTVLQNTYIIIILCNIVHFFSSPYLMMKNSLTKMNGSFETTAKLMGDSWFKTVIRVITPNAISSILEVFELLFY